LVQLGFIVSKADTSLFIYNKAGVRVYLQVYVDDIVVMSSSLVAVNALLQDLGSEFALKDLGELHYFLVQVTQTKDDFVLSQDQYTRDVLRRAGMYHCKLVKTPLATSTKVLISASALLDAEDSSKYISIIGGLQYLMLTRPDISFAVNRVWQQSREF
jgi:hypothetical protein